MDSCAKDFHNGGYHEVGRWEVGWSFVEARGENIKLLSMPTFTPFKTVRRPIRIIMLILLLIRITLDRLVL